MNAEQIFKIQIPIKPMKGIPLALLYNKARDVQFTMPVDDKVREFMGTNLKLFIYATVEKGIVDIDLTRKAPWQEW